MKTKSIIDFVGNTPLVEAQHIFKADVIVELGPGNGAITKYITENLSPTARLICFEINDNFI